jgi:hypothetical protein
MSGALAAATFEFTRLRRFLPLELRPTKSFPGISVLGNTPLGENGSPDLLSFVIKIFVILFEI